ncbi:DedA family protein [Pseudonocardiaceae bacterium YIM PH 21723]|nr:DedA family protein [Pseudonocardiaceae bacterium YIM PH 21723]
MVSATATPHPSTTVRRVNTEWILLMVFAVAAIPMAPTDAVLFASGALAARGDLPLAAVIAAAAAGAATSDFINYLIGRTIGPAVTGRLKKRKAGQVALDWLTDQIDRRGELILVAARFVPCGGLAGALLSGAMGLRVRRFLPISLAGSVLWCTYAGLLGYLGGQLTGDPIYGFCLALVIALALGILFGKLAKQKRPEETGDPVLQDA